MGISAQNQAMSNYKNTVRQFQTTVGNRFSDLWKCSTRRNKEFAIVCGRTLKRHRSALRY